MEQEKNRMALLFAGYNVSDEERFRVGKEIEKVGGLTFRFEKHEEGWSAQCNELDSIIVGNSNPNPTNTEIESEIRQAIFSAFDVQVLDGESIKSPFQFAYDGFLPNLVGANG